MKFTVLISGFMLAAALGGCATAPTSSTAPAAARGPAQDAAFHPDIDLEGRLAVRYQRNGSEESSQASFRWHQQNGEIDIVLLSPLGQTVARITVNAREAVLQEGGKPARVAADLEGLSYEMLGWPLPAAGLRAWLQAYGAQGARLAAAGSDGAQAAVDGWAITYTSWQQDEETGELRPRRIDLTRDTPNGLVALRIVLDGWRPIN